MIPSGLVHAVDGTGLPGSGAGSPITRRDAEGGGDGLGERHPQTGESIEIAASKSPAFKAGKTLRDAVR